MINCIVAVDKNQGIGNNNSLPWPRLSTDMAFFKNITSGHVIIMGSATRNSLPNSLPDRINVVLSKSKNYSNSDHTFNDIDTAIAFCENEYIDKEIFIIGGSAIYQQTMHLIDTFYITEINAEYKCDRFFNLSYVKKHCKTIIDHATINDPVNYTIKEYRL